LVQLLLESGIFGICALDVGISREVAVNQFADRHQTGAEIVGNREFVAAEILFVWPDPVVIENLQPFLGSLLSPSDGAGVCLIAAALVVRKQLRIDQSITKIAIRIGC
jgi:hypothetical protein